MELITVEMQVPKEGKEVVDLIDAILEKVYAEPKSKLEDYLGLIGKITTAVDGIMKVKEEIKTDYKDELMGYLVQKVGARLLPKAEAAPAAPAAQ